MQDGILSGPEIVKRIKEGFIEVDPFVESHVNPNSLDLTLGTKLAVYDQVVDARVYPRPTVNPDTASQWRVRYDPSVHGEDYVPGTHFRPLHGVLDMAQENKVVYLDIDRRGFVLLPGILYLMHTAERVLSKKEVPVLDGKSSIGRLGIKVHETAGYGDIGFDGQYTLEVTVVQPVRVYAGVRICQIRFHTVCGELDSYQSHKSNYVGDFARGPVPSRAWRMFKK